MPQVHRCTHQSRPTSTLCDLERDGQWHTASFGTRPETRGDIGPNDARLGERVGAVGTVPRIRAAGLLRDGAVGRFRPARRKSQHAGPTEQLERVASGHTGPYPQCDGLQIVEQTEVVLVIVDLGLVLALPRLLTRHLQPVWAFHETFL
jgi:hypothetical protein